MKYTITRKRPGKKMHDLGDKIRVCLYDDDENYLGIVAIYSRPRRGHILVMPHKLEVSVEHEEAPEHDGSTFWDFSPVKKE